MDPRSFDRLAAVVGKATSRRSAIRATIGALVAGTFGLKAAGADAARRKRLDAMLGPMPEGPCTAKPVGNNCKADSECCTKNCNGKKCRWVRPGGRCSSNRQCKSHLCQNGRCSGVNPGVLSGEPCTRSTSCANADATCTAYTFGWPGEFCLLPTDAFCSQNGECASGLCWNDACAESCTVCAEGCPYSTIGEAVNEAEPNSVIGIAPGIYIDPVTVDGNLAFVRCGDRGTVGWTTASATDAIVTVTGNSTVGLMGLELYGSVPFSTKSLVEMLDSNPNNSTTFIAVDCTFRDFRGANSAVNLNMRNNALIHNCVFDNLQSEGPGGAIGYSEGAGPSYLDIHDSTFTNNQAGWNNQGNPTSLGGALGLTQVFAEIHGSTFEHNRAVQGGAIAVLNEVILEVADSLLQYNEATGSNIPGIEAAVGGAVAMNAFVFDGEMNAIVEFSGSTRVVDNVAEDGGGGVAAVYGISNPGLPTQLTYLIRGVNNRVYRNTANPQCVRSYGDGDPWTEIVNCAM